MNVLRRLRQWWRSRRYEKWRLSMIGKTVIANGRCCQGASAGDLYVIDRIINGWDDFGVTPLKKNLLGPVERPRYTAYLCPRGIERIFGDPNPLAAPEQ